MKKIFNIFCFSLCFSFLPLFPMEKFIEKNLCPKSVKLDIAACWKDTKKNMRIECEKMTRERCCTAMAKYTPFCFLSFAYALIVPVTGALFCYARLQNEFSENLNNLPIQAVGQVRNATDSTLVQSFEQIASLMEKLKNQ